MLCLPKILVGTPMLCTTNPMFLIDFERRAIVAAGEVQSLLHCAVSFHPGRDPQAPFEIMRIFLEAGGDKRRTVMSHLDRKLYLFYMLL